MTRGSSLTVIIPGDAVRVRGDPLPNTKYSDGPNCFLFFFRLLSKRKFVFVLFACDEQ